MSLDFKRLSKKLSRRLSVLKGSCLWINFSISDLKSLLTALLISDQTFLFGSQDNLKSW